MTNYTDAWFMKESLAFYMSTNFPNEPLDEFARGDETSHAKGQTPESQNYAQGHRYKNKICDSSRGKKRELASDSSITQAKRKGLRNFCDNVKYSIRDQMFVVRMRLGRAALCIQRATRSCFCWASNSNVSTRTKDLQAKDMKICDKAKWRDNNLMKYRPEPLFLNSIAEETNEDELRRQEDSDNDDDDEDNLYYDDQFWERHAREPTTKESFGRQEEQILTRLEGTIQMKRQIAKELSDEDFDWPISSLAIFPMGDSVESDSHGSGHDSSSDQLFGQLARRKRKRFPCSSSSSSLGAEDHQPKVSERKGGSWRHMASARVADGSLGSHACSSEGRSQTSCSLDDARPDVNRKVRLYRQLVSRRDSQQSSQVSSCSEMSSEDDESRDGYSRSFGRKRCVVCYTNQVNVKTEPCNHQEICSDCFLEIIYQTIKSRKYPLKCVLCRRRIESIKCSKGLPLKSTYAIGGLK